MVALDDMVLLSEEAMTILLAVKVLISGVDETPELELATALLDELLKGKVVT